MFSFFGLVFLSTVLAVQDFKRETAQQFNNWFVPALKFHKYVGLNLEGQLRFNEFSHNQQHQARTWLDLYLCDQVAFSPIGYVYAWNYEYGEQPLAVAENEHQIFEQVVMKFSAGRMQFNNRLRLEQRWQEHQVKQANGTYEREGYTYKNRFRYRLMLDIPLGKHKKVEARTFYISVWDEVFTSFGKSVTYNLPDQNRAYLGFG